MEFVATAVNEEQDSVEVWQPWKNMSCISGGQEPEQKTLHDKEPPDPLNILLTRVDIVANYQYLEVHVESKPDCKGGLLRNLSYRCSSSCWSLVALLRQQAGETYQKISTLE